METMNDKLAEIIASKEAEWKRLEPIAAQLKKTALARTEFRSFRSAINRGEEIGLIAEVKKASPSVGVIAPNFNPINQAREYARGGAHALSILTDEKYFHGKLSYLEDIRTQVDLPILRKDFIVHEWQVYESSVAGADAILLIVAAFKDDEPLQHLFDVAASCHLDVLVEVHDLREMDRALDIGADIVGINNRNLKTFQVDLKTTAELAEEIPSDCVAVSESGIKTEADARFVRDQGINAILVGETLMRADNISAKIAELLLKE